MADYRVVILEKDANGHSEAFREMAITLVASIRECGFSCELNVNRFTAESVHILLGYHLLNIGSIPAGIRYVVYQLEQLSDSEGIIFHRPEVLEILARAESVWDYSPENVAFLAARGIIADLIPVGYSPALTGIIHSEKDIDILFYGSRNERRTAVLQELHDRGFTVKALFGLYGEQRDSWISRASLVINVHYYEANLFESVRISYLVNNAIPVLSETSPSYPWDSVPLEMVPYVQLADRAEQLLGDRVALDLYGKTCQKKFAHHYPMTVLLEKFLQR